MRCSFAGGYKCLPRCRRKIQSGDTDFSLPTKQ